MFKSTLLSTPCTGRQMSRALLEEFIATYKNHPCLWKMKCKDYLNKDLKHEAYQKLEQICRKEHSNVTREFVVKKINSLRGSFRREYRRVITEGNYVPQLWFYDLMQFTAEQESDDMIESSGYEYSGSEYSEHGDVNSNENLSCQLLQNFKSNSEELNEESELNHQVPVVQLADHIDYGVEAIISMEENGLNDSTYGLSTDTSPQSDIQSSHRGQNTYSHRATANRKIHNVPCNGENNINGPNSYDEFTAFGITVAAKLRQMDQLQRLYAENIINQTLFKGMLNQLSDELLWPNSNSIEIKKETSQHN